MSFTYNIEHNIYTFPSNKNEDLHYKCGKKNLLLSAP